MIKLIVEQHQKLKEAVTSRLTDAIYETLDYLIEFEDIFPFPKDTIFDSWRDMYDSLAFVPTNELAIAEDLMKYIKRDIDFTKKNLEIADEDPQTDLSIDIYNQLKRAYDREIARLDAEDEKKRTGESLSEDSDYKYDRRHGPKDIFAAVTAANDFIVAFEEEHEVKPKKYNRSSVIIPEHLFSESSNYTNVLEDLGYTWDDEIDNCMIKDNIRAKFSPTLPGIYFENIARKDTLDKSLNEDWIDESSKKQLRDLILKVASHPLFKDTYDATYLINKSDDVITIGRCEINKKYDSYEIKYKKDALTYTSYKIDFNKNKVIEEGYYISPQKLADGGELSGKDGYANLPVNAKRLPKLSIDKIREYSYEGKPYVSWVSSSIMIWFYSNYESSIYYDAKRVLDNAQNPSSEDELKTNFNESLKEDVFHDWKPDISFKHIKDIYDRAKKNNYHLVNNEYEEFRAAVDKAAKGGYKPEQCRQVKDWHRDIWQNSINKINEASYGGAYDIEDDQYFTKEEIVEVAEEVVEYINKKLSETFVMNGAWYEDNQFIVNVATQDSWEEYEQNVHVDMRKIRKPRDLSKYIPVIAEKLIKDIEEYHEFDESLTKDRQNYGHTGPWWYFTTHGIQPGSIPKDVNVIETRDGQNRKGTNGTFVALDGVLTTQELKDYDIIELSPDWNKSEDDEFDFSDSFNESVEDSTAERKLLNYINVSKKFDTLNGIKCETTDKGNIHVTADGKDLTTIDKSKFTEDEIDDLRTNGYWVSQENESLKESTDSDTPHSRKELEQELKDLTNNFTVEKDTLRCGFAEEASDSVNILKNHYIKVNSKKVGNWYEVSFSDNLHEEE